MAIYNNGKVKMKEAGCNVVFVLMSFLMVACDQQTQHVESYKISLQIVNLSSNESVVISNVLVLNGSDKKPKSYPFLIEPNGGTFDTILAGRDNMRMSGLIVFTIQNQGTFTINIVNSQDWKAVIMGPNSIRFSGSLRFITKEINWYFEALAVKNTYNMVIILNSND
jgi:hypothetical protein